MLKPKVAGSLDAASLRIMLPDTLLFAPGFSAAVLNSETAYLVFCNATVQRENCLPNFLISLARLFKVSSLGGKGQDSIYSVSICPFSAHSKLKGEKGGWNFWG